jgi:hypothetical protein
MLPDSVLLLPNVAGTQLAAVCLSTVIDHVCLAGLANTMHISGVTWLPWTLSDCYCQRIRASVEE